MLCSADVCRLCESSISSPPPGGSPRFLALPGPSLGRGLHPSSSALHFAGPVVSVPCLARVSLLPPALSAGYFYPLLVQRCFWGYSGEATPNLLSSRCAPRSGPLLEGAAARSSQGMRMECAPLLLLQPELSKPRHQRLGCSARRSLREPIPGEFLRARAQVLDRL